MNVSIVIPVYHEEESLPLLYDELDQISRKMEASQHRFEFIFVDDGSKDGSAKMVQTFSERDDRVKAIIFRRNYGQTAAMSCGIKAATGDVIIPMDADLQNDPADIPFFLAKIEEGYSCVSGWRKNRQDTFFTRRIPSWLANALISWMTGVHLHDYGCSMKAYRRDIIEDVELYGEMHRFIPAYAVWCGARVTEIVVHHRARQFGVSKYGLSRIPKVLLDLLVVKFLTGYFNKPIHFFGIIGFISFAFGIVAELIALILKFYGISFILTPLPIIGMMFIIVGIQFILFGLMTEVLMRTYYESRGSHPYAVRETHHLDKQSTII